MSPTDCLSSPTAMETAALEMQGKTKDFQCIALHTLVEQSPFMLYSYYHTNKPLRYL